jgi:hypothetical protein
MSELLLPFLSLLAVLLVFGSLAIFLSMVLPSRQMASMVSGILLVASYFLTSLTRLNGDLKAFSRFLPLDYYQTTEAINAFNLAWFFELLAVAALLSILAGVIFKNRDIRVGGEGSWNLLRKKP